MTLTIRLSQALMCQFQSGYSTRSVKGPGGLGSSPSGFQNDVPVQWNIPET